jgi:hypothetical protein
MCPPGDASDPAEMRRRSETGYNHIQEKVGGDLYEKRYNFDWNERQYL